MLDAARLERAAEAKLAASERTKDADVSKRTSLTFVDWCHQKIVLRGKPFSLDRRAYQAEPYQDDHPDQRDQKAAQTGGSVRWILKGFYAADRYGAKVVHYLSTDDDAEDFSQDRVSKVIEESPYLQERMDEPERGRDNVGLRHIGDGAHYVRGLFTRRKVKSIDADLVVLDETDEANQDNIEFAKDRILASELAWLGQISQPSLPDFGINAAFKEGDQRHYMLVCPACRQRNCLELNLEDRDGRQIPKHFIEIPEMLRKSHYFLPGQRYYRACEKCHTPLDMAQGEWVARYSSITDVRSRLWSQLYRELPMKKGQDPADGIMLKLLRARKTREKMRLTISIIGMPYGGDRQPITEGVLDDCEGDDVFFERAFDCYMGIDQGDELHIVVLRDTPSGTPQVIYVEHADDWGAIERARDRFGVVATVGDAMPNKKPMKDLALASKTDFWIQYFNDSHPDPKADVEGEGGRQVQKVIVSRDDSLDDTVDWLVDGDVLLPCMAKLLGKELADYETFRAQCMMLVKDLVQTAKGVWKWSFRKNVPNHFGMALNSARIARALYRGEMVDLDAMDTSGEKRVTAPLHAPEPDTPQTGLAWQEDESDDLFSLARATAGAFSDFGY